jgi:RNA polymerase sigma-70 factor, ECF subfamily
VDYDGLFRQLHPQLVRFLNRLMGDADAAEDVAQEAFVRLTRQNLEEEEVRPWLFTVAMNLVRDRGRRAERHRRLEGRIPAPRASTPPDRAAERSEAVASVRRALAALSERDRTMLLMREEGFRYGEIARAVGVAPGSVGTLLARAGRRFAEVYSPSTESLETIHDTSG